MKQLKNLEQEYEKLKLELSQKEYIIERNGITLKFNGLGDIIALDISKDIENKTIKDFQEDLKLLLKEYQDMVKDNLVKSLKDRFIGGLPFGF